jgi:hypothetical protein
VDFCVTKGIPQDFAVAKSCFDLSSDHSPVLITPTSHALNQEKQPSLSNRHLIKQRLNLNVFLKTEEDIEATVKFFNDTVQRAGWNATPGQTHHPKTNANPILFKKNKKKKTKKKQKKNRKNEGSVEVGTDYEHQGAKNYLTQQHRNSNNSSIGTKMIASTHSCKVLHQQNPPTIPCGRRLRK